MTIALNDLINAASVPEELIANDAVLMIQDPITATYRLDASIDAVSFGFDESLVIEAKRVGNDIILVLSNGETIRLVDYFEMVAVADTLYFAGSAAFGGLGALAAGGAGLLAAMSGGGGGEDADTTIDAPLTTAATNGTALSGTAEPGGTVTLTWGDPEQSVTVDVDENGNWFVDRADLPPGGLPHETEVSIIQTDAAGNEEGPFSVVVDALTPAPVINAIETNAEAPVISGTAEAGATLVVVVGGATFEVVADENGAWSLDLAEATPVSGRLDLSEDGVYDVVATATDAVGNAASDSTAGEFVIDRTIVDPTIEPTDGSALNGTGEPGATVTITYPGLEEPITAVVDPNGNWAVDSVDPAIPNETPLTITQEDAAGNISDPQMEEIDSAIDAPALDPVITNNPSPTISGQAEPGAIVEVEVGGATFTVDADPDTGAWSLNTGLAAPTSGVFSALDTDGPYEVSATATDEAGNTNSDTSTNEVTIDTVTTNPTVSSATTSNTSPTLSGTAEPGSAVEVVVGGATDAVDTHPATGAWSVDKATAVPTAGSFTPLADGEHDVVATATDPTGNMASDTSTNEITIDTAIAPPTVDPIISNNPSPTLTGTAEPGAAVSVTIGGATFTVPADPDTGAWSVDTSSTAPSSGTFAPLTDGQFDVAVRATDPAGNTATDTSDNELTIDTATAAPTIDPLTTNTNTPTVTGSAEPGAVVAVTIGGATYQVTADPTTGTWSVNTATATPSSGALFTAQRRRECCHSDSNRSGRQ